METIQRIQQPQTLRQLRRFLGMINCYRDMWKRQSHVLVPLAAMVARGKNKLEWTDEAVTAFEEAKRMTMRETLLAYPDFSQAFEVFMDASDYQLGAVIMQNGKLLAFYTQKINSAQANHTMAKKELLGKVEGIKAFDNILRGQKTIVHTDNLNLLYKKMASQRLVQWRIMLEEYAPKVRHIQGKKNRVVNGYMNTQLIQEGPD